jgi:hypothetical protein
MVLFACKQKENEHTRNNIFTNDGIIENLSINNYNNETNNMNDSDNEDMLEQQFITTHWVKENLRLRDGPDTKANILKILQTGTAVQKLDLGKIETIDNITAPWMFIKTENEEKGWCFGGYLADYHSMLLGIWIEGEKETGWSFYYFTENKILFGILASDNNFGVGKWNIEGNNIKFEGKIIHLYTEEDNSSYIPFSIVNYNKIEIYNGTIFTRISDQDLSEKSSSKKLLDELINKY